jgi:hypothetical protein
MLNKPKFGTKIRVHEEYSDQEFSFDYYEDMQQYEREKCMMQALDVSFNTIEDNANKSTPVVDPDISYEYSEELPLEQSVLAIEAAKNTK